jgi:mRNA interferase MazF
MDMVKLKRFNVCLVNLDPTIGSEINKTRPVVIISPDSMNISRLNTVIVAPMTSTIRDHFPTRINIIFKGKKGQIALDQIRVIDRNRIIKVLATIRESVQDNILNTLAIMFTR